MIMDEIYILHCAHSVEIMKEQELLTVNNFLR